MDNVTIEPVAVLSQAEILSRVRAFVQDNFLYMLPDFILQDNDSLMENGVVDSMGVAEMLAFLEEEFEVHIADDEISEANLGSLHAISSFIVSRQA